MRLTGTVYALEKRVRQLRLRLRVAGLPGAASVTVTDLQLQAGETATSLVPNPEDAGSTPGRVHYRSGVVNGRMKLVILANLDRAAPTRVRVESVHGTARIGSYRFGRVTGTAEVDGARQAASQGWGRTPILTERSDLTIPAQIDGRAHLRVSWAEQET